MSNTITKQLKSYIEKQKFEPDLLSLFINPLYFVRYGLMENIRDLGENIKGKTLDVGCGNKPYKNYFQSSEYLGLEIDSIENRARKRADYFYNGQIFPFSDDEFDSIVTNEVFEHVFEPELFLSEINRVLKIKGFILVTVPFVWDEHEQPVDYARYSSFGLKHILNKYGFEVIVAKKSIADIRVVFQLLNLYIYKKALTNNQYINIITTIFLMSPFNLLGVILAKILPENDDLYLNNIILAKKIKSVLN